MEVGLRTQTFFLDPDLGYNRSPFKKTNMGPFSLNSSKHISFFYFNLNFSNIMENTLLVRIQEVKKGPGSCRLSNPYSISRTLPIG